MLGNAHYKVVEMAAGSVLTGRLVHVESSAPRCWQFPDVMGEAASL